MDARNILNVRELLLGQSNQIRYVERYNNVRTLKRETLPEHLFFTAFYALVLGKYIRDCGVEIDMGCLLQRALLHDVEEQFTGDVIRPVKSLAISQELKSYSKDKIFTMFHRMGLIVHTSHALTYAWENAKSNDNEGVIIRIADFMCVLSYVHQEFKSGNVLILDSVSGLIKYVDSLRPKFMTKDTEIFNPVIHEILDSLEPVIDTILTGGK